MTGPATGSSMWLHLVLPLAIGPMVVAAVTWAVSGCVRSAPWRRAFWQMAVLAMLLLVVLEWTGMAGAVAGWFPAGPAASVTQGAGAGWQGRPPRGSGSRRGIAASGGGEEQLGAPAPGMAGQAAADRDGGSNGPGRSERGGWVGEDLVGAQWPGRADVRSPTAGWLPGWEAWGETGRGSTAAGEAEVLQPFGEHGHAAPAGLGGPRRGGLGLSGRGEVSRSGSGAVCPFWPGVLWGIGAVLVGLRALWCRLALVVLRRRGSTVGAQELGGAVAGLARRLGIRRPVRVAIHRRVPGPVAFGWLAPTVALPPDFGRGLTRSERDVVLAHELAHLAAGDPLWRLLCDLVCAALWWHPVCWWVRGRLELASEVAADEASLLIPGGPDALAECLVRLGREISAGRRLGWVGFSGPFRSTLGRRVDRLLRLSPRRWRRVGRHRLAATRSTMMVVLAMVGLFCTAWVRPQVPHQEGETTMCVLKRSWQQSLAAALLAVLWAPNGSDAWAGEGPDEPDRPAATDRDPGPRDETGPARRDADEGPRGDAGEPDADRGDRAERRDRGHREAVRPKAARRDHREAVRPEAVRRDHPPAPRERAARDRPPREMPPEELARQRHELQERVIQLKRKMGELRDDQDEEARRITAEIHALQDKIRQLGEVQKRIGPPRFGSGRLRAEAGRQLAELKRALEAARAAGRHEEAERLRRKAEELVQKFRSAHAPPPHEAAIERRVRHLRAAVENLRAAGLPDEAERVMRRLEEIQREGHGPPPPGRPEARRVPPGPPPHDRGPRPPAHAGEGPPPVQHLERAVRDLQGQIHELRAQMDEIRANLHRIAERLERE